MIITLRRADPKSGKFINTLWKIIRPQSVRAAIQPMAAEQARFLELRKARQCKAISGKDAS